MDPQKAVEEAQIIADRLSELDSDHRETYQANARKFQEEAKELNPLEADPANQLSYLENLEKNLAVLAKDLKG